MKITANNFRDLAFAKTADGLMPAIIQDVSDNRVLMLGYVNEESLEQTFIKEHVTFFSRSRQSLWTKGETSGNYFNFIEAYADCDRDAILILVHPEGPACHTGAESCFEDFVNADDAAETLDNPDGSNESGESAFAKTAPDTAETLDFLQELEDLLYERKADANSESYTSRLLAKGIMKVAQKVGEEGVEMALEAVGGTDELLLEEAADLMYHYLLLLRAKDKRLTDVVEVLRKRNA